MKGISHRLKLLFLLPFISFKIIAAPSSLTVNVEVELWAPPCTINDNKPIEINFYDVMTTRIDGKNYRTKVDYTLDCKGAPSNFMKLQVQGIGASFDSSVLGVPNFPGLGIELQEGNKKIAINSWLNFIYPDYPQLWATPVKKSGITLEGGRFETAATMKIDYQ